VSLFNQLGEYGLNQLIARRLTTPGPAPSPTVEPAIFPSLVLESDRPEWGWNKGERLCASVGGVTAVAGQYSVFGFSNPAGSNVIATVTSCAILPGATSVVAKITQSALAVAPGTAGVRDTRWNISGFTGSPVCSPLAGATLVLAPNASMLYLPASVYTQRPIEFVVTPGWQFILVGLTVNVGFTAADLQWRERTAQPGEL